MNKNLSIFFLVSLLPLLGMTQTATLKGKVFNTLTNEPVPFAVVAIQGTTTAATADVDGNYVLQNLLPGQYNIDVTFIGYRKKSIFEVSVFNSKVIFLDVPMEEEVKNIKEVEIKASPFNKTQESPLSLRTIGVSEIERNPGGNRDISRVIQSFPGVASTASFRNDIIIRGGAPNENRFYLDGVEVPVINHFATQGSSGGPVGMINVNFIREVDFHSGAFPANRGNALSSVFEFKQKEGNKEKWGMNFTLGPNDLGVTGEGPTGKNSSLIFSVRRSYLQFLFAALKLPFLPIYNDFQFKYKWKINPKTELTAIGLGALDDFELNKEANETEEQKYFLANLPIYKQWNYTNGITLKRFTKNGNLLLVLSRNMLNNRSYKYKDNDESSPDNRILDYISQEMENKLRAEHTLRTKGFRINYGIAAEYVKYNNSTYNKISIAGNSLVVNYASAIELYKYGVFGQVSRGLFNERLVLSFGLRTDANTFSSKMADLSRQISPRFSLSYGLLPGININANVGRYYQLPPYTVMGYRDATGELVNKTAGIDYIRCDHTVAGIEFNTSSSSKITIEGFYKWYDNYPFLLREQISLANLGADFGVIGNAPVNSSSKGRSYGLEFLAQQKMMKGFYGIVSFTLVRSDFTNAAGVFQASAWDNRYILSLTGGKKFGKNWEIGFRYRWLGGLPYTPVNQQFSSLVSVWDINRQGVPDYARVNSLRLSAFNQLDFRIDKKWFLKRWNLNLYFDVQNAGNSKNQQPPLLLLDRDAQGNPIVDNSATNIPSYRTRFIQNTAGTVIPSIGVIIEL
jgi:hypothetical protein